MFDAQYWALIKNNSWKKCARES